jgi:hypothetical protein
VAIVAGAANSSKLMYPSLAWGQCGVLRGLEEDRLLTSVLVSRLRLGVVSWRFLPFADVHFVTT